MGWTIYYDDASLNKRTDLDGAWSIHPDDGVIGVIPADGRLRFGFERYFWDLDSGTVRWSNQSASAILVSFPNAQIKRGKWTDVIRINDMRIDAGQDPGITYVGNGIAYWQAITDGPGQMTTYFRSGLGAVFSDINKPIMALDVLFAVSGAPLLKYRTRMSGWLSAGPALNYFEWTSPNGRPVYAQSEETAAAIEARYPGAVVRPALDPADPAYDTKLIDAEIAML